MVFSDFGNTEERLAAILQHTNCGTWSHDFSSGIVCYDERAQQLLGIPGPSLDFADWSAIVHPDDRSATTSVIADGVKHQKEHVNVCYRVVVNGRLRWLKVDSFIRYEQGHPRISYGLIQDITEIKSGEAALAKTNRELREALSQVETLRGILPTCMYCKRIRPIDRPQDDPRPWTPIETYISEHSKALFSHGICPDCFRELHGKGEFPELFSKEGRCIKDAGPEN